MKRRLVAFVFAVLPLAFGLQAQVTAWTGAIDNDWFEAGNWNNGVPTNSTNFFIQNGGTSRITTGGAAFGDSPSVGTNIGAGTLEILDGFLTTSQITFGLSNGGGTGTLLVSGSNASMSATDRMNIGASGIGQVTVTNGGTLTSSTNTFMGITGSGTLNINGTTGSRGTVEVRQISEGSGSGQINFNGGILRALATQSNLLQNFETGDVTINSGGAFIDSNGFNVGIPTVLGGTGPLTKQGAGTLTLSGANTYTGLTTISAGDLQIGNGGTTGSILGDVVNNGFLIFNRSDDIAFGGTVTGTGGLGMTGTGRLDWTGSNSGGLGTFVDAGTLAVSGTINHPGGTLVVANGAGTSGALEISGTGSVATGTGFVGFGDGSTGLATITSGTWTNASSLVVGAFGSGTVEISGTGSMTSDGGVLGLNDGANGTVRVSTGSWTNSGALAIGVSGTGLLEVSGTGSVSNTIGSLGSDALSTGTANVSGGVWTNFVGLIVGDEGTGIVNLTGGAINATGGIELSSEVGSTGTFNLGTGESTGVLNSPSIFGGSGTAVVNLNHTGSATLAANITGSTSLNKLALGTTVLTGTNTYTGATTISAGTLWVGDGGASGTLGSGAVTNNGFLVFNRSNDLSVTTDISGNGSLTKQGAGILTLDGTNSYIGGTSVLAGNLRIAATGSIGNNVTVDSGATLSGAGTVGSTTIQNGGILAPGTSPGTLTTGSLLLFDHAQLNFELDTPNVVGGGVNDLIQVNGDLTLDGILNITDLGGFGAGTYRLLNYTGSLTNFGLQFGSVPSLFDYNLDLGTAGQINLGVTAAVAQFWDGANTVPNGVIDGGTGTWEAATTNWTNAAGNANSAWAGDVVATFAGTAGTVTIADGFTANPRGLNFLTTGYTIAAAGSGNLEINGDTGFSLGSGIAATVSAPITGTGRVIKEGAGSLTLSGANAYSGGTMVIGGTLTAASDDALGTGTFLINGATATGVIASGVDVSNHIVVMQNGTLNIDGIASGSQGIVSVASGTVNVGVLGSVDRLAASAIGIDMIGGGTVTNAGSIAVTGLAAQGINFGAEGGSSNLVNSGEILVLGGIESGVRFNGADSTFINSGTLTSAGTGGVAVIFNAGGTLENSGTIEEDALLGIGVFGDAAPVTVNNRSGATISAAELLSSDDRAILLNSGGVILNESGATISSDGFAIQAGDTLQLTNAGVINGNVVTSAADDQLTLLGGTITGDVDLGGGRNALILGGTGRPVVFSQAVTGTLTGASTLSKTGGNTWILDRDFAPVDGTTIEQGTLQIGNGGTTGSISGDLTNNGELTFNRSDAVTFAGVISGSGGLTKTGGSTLALTGDSTFTGGTTIRSGTLQLGDGGRTGWIVGDVVNRANLTFNRADDVTFDGKISGSGAVTQRGSGTLNLLGKNSYTGGTTIEAGTVRAQSRTALGNGNVVLAGGSLEPVGTLSINSLDWKGGTIESNLGAPMSYIDIRGKLRVGNGGGEFVFGAGDGFAPGDSFRILSAANLSNRLLARLSGNALFGLDPIFTRERRDLFVTFSPSSDGSILQNSSPVFTPTDADFLVRGEVRTGSPSENNRVNSLTFDPDSSLQVFNDLTVTSGNFAVPTGRASLSGDNVLTPRDFTKTGAGALDTTTSAINVGRAALVSEGALFVNGNFITSEGLTVGPDALLGGGGTIGGNVLNEGTVNPGNSPGTLTLNGDFAQTNSGTLQIEAASLSSFDRLIVNGDAALAGTLQFLPTDGFQPAYGQQFAFLEAEGISGTFGSILLPGAFRGRFIDQDGTGVLVLAPDSYARVATNQNQHNVANALDSFIPATGDDREVMSAALDLLSEDQYPAAFNQIMPAFHESVADIGINLAQTQGQLIQQHLSAVRLGGRGFRSSGLSAAAFNHEKDGKMLVDPKSFESEVPLEAPANPRWAFWSQGNGIFARTASLAAIPSYRFESGGFLAGADYQWNESLVTGLFAGYQYLAASYDNGADTRMNGVRFGGYATYDPVDSGFYADAVVWGGASNYKTDRKLKFSTIERTARASQDTSEFSSLLGGGYDWEAGNFTFGPAVSVQYTYFGVAPFTESGADSLDLRVGQQNANSLQSYIGGRIAYTARLSEDIILIPEVRMFWQHEFLDNPRTIDAALDGGTGPDFAYRTQNPSRDAVFAGAGATLQVGQSLTTYFNYNADFGQSDSTSHIISAGLGLSF